MGREFSRMVTVKNTTLPITDNVTKRKIHAVKQNDECMYEAYKNFQL